MKPIVKQIAAAVGVVVLFLALSYGFVPKVLGGKIVNQSDISGYVGMSQEMNQWNKAHPEDPAYWSDSMFGGMPTTAIAAPTKGDCTQWIYKLLMLGKRPATYLFVTLLGAFLLFLALGVSWPVAIGGAIAVAFCSYNFQIIQVGHNTKMQAIAFMPWVLAALVYTYRKRSFASAQDDKKTASCHSEQSCHSERSEESIWRTVLGATLFGLALSMQIKANHQQITYYLAIMVLLYALAEFIHTFRTKEWKRFWIASALLLVLGGAGIATNVNKLLPLAKYTPHTMRGGSELSTEGANSKGLDLDYATAWSYGWEELPNMLIPNFNGGSSSGAVNPDKSETIALLKKYGQKNLRETAKALPLYWGPQPFTAGPMYMGAIAVFLFVLGLGLYKGREKWWLLAATIIAILMAVGSHFMAFTAFCFKYLPLYNKFRTVSMALVVLQVSLPVLGFLTLDRIARAQYSRESFLKAFWWALGITGGFCLLAWLAPGMFGSFSGAADSQMQDVLVDALIADRIMLFRQDAGVSLLLIALSAGALFWAYLPKGPEKRRLIAAVGIGLLSLVNLFVVGKRYLNADDFTTPKDFNKPFAERPADKIILEDQDPQYRVLDITVNVFNSSVPSYRHKNVGGYSPAKLQRYQDLIDHYLTGEINGIYKALGDAETLDDVSDYMADKTPVLNALNTRYLIVDSNYPPVENYAAFGPAWFVDSVVEAATPDEEIALIGQVDLQTQAVVDARSFAVAQDDNCHSERSEESPSVQEGSIEMTSYTPNEVRYRYTASSAKVAVFSEIFYPGWKATVDGQPLELFRADWTLRGALLPAGDHEVVMRFRPQSYRTGATVSLIASLLLLLALAAAVVLSTGILGRKRP